MARSEKTAEKKRQILEAALECFELHGVEATTIDMIRQASGVSVGSLYHHFGNKESIAAAVYRQGMREFGDTARQYLAEAESLEDKVKALVYADVDWIADNPSWAKFVFHYRRVALQGDKKNEWAKDLNTFYKELINEFLSAYQDGSIKKLPFELYSPMIVGPVHEYARHWLAGRSKVPIKQHREIFAEMAWQGLKVDFES